MKPKCLECDADMDIPDDLIDGEIISCSDSGIHFEVNIKENQEIELKPAEIEGADWGE
jgi:alpha-aminoadipate carrier protein LysW